MMNIMDVHDQAMRAMSLGHYEEAVDLYDQVLRDGGSGKEQTITLAFIGKFESLLQLGRNEQADALITSMEQTKPRYDSFERRAVSAHCRAKLFYVEANYEKAVAALRRELTALSSRGTRYFIRLTENYLAQSLCFQSMDDWDEARIYLNLAGDYADTDDDAMTQGTYHAVSARWALGRGDTRVAEAHLRKAHAHYMRAGSRVLTDLVNAAQKRINETGTWYPPLDKMIF